jgi:AraC-like DNA-binding protein
MGVVLETLHEETRAHWRVPGFPEVDVVRLCGTSTPWRELHETFTICNVISGPDVRWRCGRLEYTRAVGRAMFVRPGDLHMDLAPSASTIFEVIRLPSSTIEAMIGDASTLDTAPREIDSPTVLARITRFQASVRSNPTGDRAARGLKDLVDALLALRATERAVEHVALRRARAHMAANIASEITLDELACVARMSKFQLVKVFQRQVGCAPHQYHVYMRVARARSLLANGSPCGEVAHLVGFSDQSHLNRWFKRLFELSPGAYQHERRWPRDLGVSIPRRPPASPISSPQQETT